MTETRFLDPAVSLVGVVLAGGTSRRMGRDKALLALEGETLALRAARKLAAVTDEVLVADRGRGTVPGYLSVEDGPAAGPAAALLGAAAARPAAALLVLACDLPHVPVEMLRELAALDRQADLILPHTPQPAHSRRRLEPLCAVYRPRALAALRRQVEAGEWALHPLVDREELRVVLWGVEGWQRFGPATTLFANWNRPEDLR